MRKLLLLVVITFAVIASAASEPTYPQIGAEVFIEPGQTPQQIDQWFKVLSESGMNVCRIRMFESYMKDAINAIRVRSGLAPLAGLSQQQLRDAILLERGHELYCEGTRRNDLIRYQRVTKGSGSKLFDVDINKFLFPIPSQFIGEFKGNITQNPGY